MTAEEIRRRSFSTAFRGFDQAEVREYLDRLAEEVRSAERREEDLQRQLREARDRVLHPRLDEETLTSGLGQEAARILRSAHEAAADVRRKAEENAARVLREAHQEVERLRSAADTVLSDRTTEADGAAEAIRAAATAEAGAVLAVARQQAEATLTEVRARCEALTQEAEAARDKVLGELARRRRVMHAQVEQLGAGREVILRSIQDVRRTVDDVIESLDRAAADAKTSADAAYTRALASPDPALEDLGDATEVGNAALADLAASLERLDQAMESMGAEGGEPGPAPAEAPVRPAAETTGPPADVPAVPPPAEPTTAPVAVPAAPPEPVGEEAAEAPERGPSVVGAGEAGAEARILRFGDDDVPGPVPADSPSAERRGGGLRLLRRSRGEGPTGPPSGDADFDEGIRIIRDPAPQEPITEPGVPETAAEPGPAEPGPAETAPAETAASGRATAEAVGTQQTGAGEAGTGQAGAEDAAGAPAAAEPAATDVEDGPAPHPAQGQPEPTAEAAKPSVDELFARLRAERAAATQDAEQVLAAAGQNGAGPEPEEPTGAHGPSGAGSLPEQPQPAGPEGGAESAAAETPGSGVGNLDRGEVEPEEVSEGRLLEERNRILAPVNDRLARKLKRTLQDDQNELLDRVRNRARGHAGPVLAEEDAHRRLYREAVRDLLAECFAGGVEFARAHLDGGGTPCPPEVGGVPDELAAALVSQLRSRLEAAVAEASTDESVVSDAVGGVYRAWKGERIESLAMDHSVAAFGTGVLAAAGADTPLRWLVDDDGGPCPDCDDNALAGATAAGHEYPTGQIRPPAHPGCRCLLVPALP